ncbi:MAG TPA: MopE-related protein [Kofleriaceae bacterium]|nr:MopE-related protein [Kofleriaceae bacterium]
MVRLGWSLAFSLVILVAGCSTWPLGYEPPDGVEVCHGSTDGRSAPRTITVSSAALGEHLAHGDTLGACEVAIFCAPAPEICGDGVDNDCDGVIDDGCEVCGDGIDNDGNGLVDEGCTQSVEICGDGLDNDGDGVVDDGCVCAPGSVEACYDGPAGTQGVGVCAAGSHVCNATGTGWGACGGEVEPAPETCGDGLDNDCDGVVDDGCPEICGDGLDNDGDGVVDDGCVCAAGAVEACYDGPAGTQGVGVCAAGSHVCNATGTGWGACGGEVEPAAETCGDGLDNDCDGVVDDGCVEICGDGLDNDGDGVVDDGCVCAPGSVEACYDGPAGTQGVGVCAAGSHVCNATGTGWGACGGEVEPAAETCGDGLDNDCDGVVDDGCAEICGDGLDNDGDGVVDNGCGEACDGVDNDGDGIIDNGCVTGRAWNDIDRDAAETPGEPGVAGVVMRLHRLQGAADVVFAMTATDDDGRYGFGAVPPGTYQVEIVVPVDWTLAPSEAAPDDVDSDFDEVLQRTPWFVMGQAGLGDLDAGLTHDTHT